MISSIMQQISSYLGITIIHEDRDGTEPTYPYASYKVLRTDFEKPHQRIRVQNELANDMVQVKHYYGTSIVIKFNFYNKGSADNLIDVIMEFAQLAWIWLIDTGKNEFAQYNLVPTIISKEIKQEETPETENKLRVSFEFVLKGSREHVSEIETISGVDYTGIIKK